MSQQVDNLRALAHAMQRNAAAGIPMGPLHMQQLASVLIGAADTIRKHERGEKLYEVHIENLQALVECYRPKSAPQTVSAAAE